LILEGKKNESKTAGLHTWLSLTKRKGMRRFAKALHHFLSHTPTHCGSNDRSKHLLPKQMRRFSLLDN